MSDNYFSDSNNISEHSIISIIINTHFDPPILSSSLESLFGKKDNSHEHNESNLTGTNGCEIKS